MFGAVFIAKAVTVNLRRSLKDKVSMSRLRPINNVIYYAIMIIAVILVLPILGFDPSGLMVAGGIAAIVIGFASQSVVSNLLSGIFLMIERPMNIGDAVNIDGTAGVVEDVRIMSTSLRTFDGVYVRIPNEKAFTNNITNYITYPIRRFEYSIGIRYQDDADKAIQIINNLIEEHPLTLKEPAPQVFVDDLGDSSVNIIARIWGPSTEWYSVKMELLWKIKGALEEVGIQIPYPQRELWINKDISG
jgi:small-conductance mechanosensitive channel